MCAPASLDSWNQDLLDTDCFVISLYCLKYFRYKLGKHFCVMSVLNYIIESHHRNFYIKLSQMTTQKMFLTMKQNLCLLDDDAHFTCFRTENQRRNRLKSITNLLFTENCFDSFNSFITDICIDYIYQSISF